MQTIKFLCICDWGQVRSVAMAQLIHELNGQPVRKLMFEAIPVGSVVSSKKTMKMLKLWADFVIDIREYLPSDIWHNPRDPELKEEVKKIWQYFVESHHLE